MTPCKGKNCINDAVEGSDYCELHHEPNPMNAFRPIIEAHNHSDYRRALGNRKNARGRWSVTLWCRKCGAWTEQLETRRDPPPNPEWFMPDPDAERE